MVRVLLSVLASLALAACASGPNAKQRYGRYVSLGANPSKVIATELAFARMAREEGTWTAFRNYATKDAVMPAPGFVDVQERLKGRADPAEPILWEPDLVWSSCSGDFALSTGPADYPDGSRGRFATIWQRQADGEYRWVVDQGFDLPADYVKPDMIPANVALCEKRGFGKGTPGRSGDWSTGVSGDGSLAWQTVLSRDCARTFVVSIRRDGEMVEVFRRKAEAPPVPPGREQVFCEG